MNRRRRPGGADRDRGVALITVIGAGVVLSILMVAAISYSIASTRSARATQDWNAALAAAYAGIEEFESRLADDTTYFRYGNPAHAFSAGSAVTLPPAAATNPAFGVGVGGTWATVAGSGGASSFRYEVDSRRFYADGTVRVRSTGRANGQTRTVVADLRQQGFADFLYFTDFEIQDPDILVAQWVAAGYGTREQLRALWDTECGRYAWAGRRSDGLCSEITFGSGDVIRGPLHSNDTLRTACSATFKARVSTAFNPATGPRYVRQDSPGVACGAGTFEIPGSPAYHPVIAMPATNTLLRKEMRSDLVGQGVSTPGCLYTGPTAITLVGDGTMVVRSPWTRATNVVGDTPTSGSAPAHCGRPGSDPGSLGGPTGAVVPVPDDNVVYVQNVPTRDTDPNYAATPPAGLTPSTATDAGNGLGYPLPTEAAPLGSTQAQPAYGPRNGDVFVSGVLQGQVTIAAENYIYAVGDVKLADARRDMLGLIGNNAVFVWNPVTSSRQSLLGGSNRRIDAAIMSVAHTFGVQNYDRGGNRGTLTVNGAIAQRFRGIVRGGSGTNGYAKNYVYDERFTSVGPPKFLSPVNVTYGVNVWVEVGRAMRADGSYR
ncbi:hypothetical protein [uncultured Cellulomonas sp.]|uniref:pilus assembly PilX family protein n=1 Tax=uncultured Cellulomonas sp. TaxID=189682 RepID=UPI0026194F04|nr:hypothetical protein [uncultured Cellulomonas sp.]